MKESNLIINDAHHRLLLMKGMELVRTLTRGTALVTVGMLQRHLNIDFFDAQWLIGQLRVSECPMDDDTISQSL